MAKKVVVVNKSRKTTNYDHVDESKIINDLPNNYHEKKENVDQKSTKKSIAFIIILFFICGIFYIVSSNGNHDSNPYNKIYKNTYEAYGETLDMYLIVHDDYCKFAVGKINNYSNSCSVSKNSNGIYVLTLDNERYKYTNGNFECINCSSSTVFKYYNKISN